MVIDIDYFKSVNDTHGHDIGDDVLREFACARPQSIRGIDLACRFGGEEFVVLMPDTDMAVAAIVAERVRARIAAEPFPIHAGTGALEVTVSIGIASFDAPDDTAASLLKRADQALYRAKRRAATASWPTRPEAAPAGFFNERLLHRPSGARCRPHRRPWPISPCRSPGTWNIPRRCCR